MPFALSSLGSVLATRYLLTSENQTRGATAESPWADNRQHHGVSPGAAKVTPVGIEAQGRLEDEDPIRGEHLVECRFIRVTGY